MNISKTNGGHITKQYITRSTVVTTANDTDITDRTWQYYAVRDFTELSKKTETRDHCTKYFTKKKKKKNDAQQSC